MGERKFATLVAYDGAGFNGWQRQAAGRTVQAELEAAVARICGGASAVVGSGRTDAGVHARGQVAHFSADTDMEPGRLRTALAAVTPADVFVRAVAEVPADWHALHSPKAKTYKYRIWNAECEDPHFYRYCAHEPRALNLEALAAALRVCEGEYDFSSFRTGPPPPNEHSVRSVHCATVERDGPLVTITVTGGGFLRHMVRTMAGTVLAVALGKSTVEDVERILAAKDRSAAGKSAPPHGLTLESVLYDPQVFPEQS